MPFQGMLSIIMLTRSSISQGVGIQHSIKHSNEYFITIDSRLTFAFAVETMEANAKLYPFVSVPTTGALQ